MSGTILFDWIDSKIFNLSICETLSDYYLLNGFQWIAICNPLYAVLLSYIRFKDGIIDGCGQIGKVMEKTLGN